MATLERLAALDLRLAVTRFRDALRAHQDELNRLNVYPVPDGDTGTNMTLTLESVVHELGTAEDMAEVCQAVAHGSLMGARGNSGRDPLPDPAGPRRHVPRPRGRRRGGSRGRAAAGVRCRLRGGDAPGRGHDPHRGPGGGRRGRGGARRRRAGAGRRSSTPRRPRRATRSSTLPTCCRSCARPGVVDAGGRGFTLLLDALLEVVAGRPIPEPDVVFTPVSVEAHLAGDDVASLRYEVMYLLDAEDSTIHGVQGDVGRARRLDRRRRWRRALELPRAHRRHRWRDRSRDRGGAAAPGPRDRPARAGRGRAVGARPGRALARRTAPSAPPAARR